MDIHHLIYLVLLIVDKMNQVKSNLLNISENSPFYFASKSAARFEDQVIILDGDFCGPNDCFNTASSWNRINPACHLCSCNEECFFYGNCCAYLLLNSNVLYTKPKHICQNPGKKHDKPNRYFLKSSCPADAPEDVKFKCEESQELDTEIHIPVTGVNDFLVEHFKNKYCAQCNGMKDLVNHAALVKCDNSTQVFINSTSYMETLNMAMLADDCSISFFSNEATPCELSDEDGHKLIETCNETGVWIEYDELVEKACLLKYYRRPVYDKYYNLFCYMCNNNSTWQDIRDDLQYINDVDRSEVKTQLEGIVTPMFGQNQTSLPHCFKIDNTGRCRELLCPYQRQFDPIFQQCLENLITNAYGYDICLVLETRLQDPSAAASSLLRTVQDFEMMINGLDLYGKSVQTYGIELWSCNNVITYKLQLRFFAFTTVPGFREFYENGLEEILNDFRVKLPSKCGNFTRYSIEEDSCIINIIPNTDSMEVIPDTHKYAMTAKSVHYLTYSKLTGCCQMLLNPWEFIVDEYGFLFILNSNRSVNDNDYILNTNNTATVCIDDYVNPPYISPCTRFGHGIEVGEYPDVYDGYVDESWTDAPKPNTEDGQETHNMPININGDNYVNSGPNLESDSGEYEYPLDGTNGNDLKSSIPPSVKNKANCLMMKMNSYIYIFFFTCVLYISRI